MLYVVWYTWAFCERTATLIECQPLGVLKKISNSLKFPGLNVKTNIRTIENSPDRLPANVYIQLSHVSCTALVTAESDLALSAGDIGKRIRPSSTDSQDRAEAGSDRQHFQETTVGNGGDRVGTLTFIEGQPGNDVRDTSHMNRHSPLKSLLRNQLVRYRTRSHDIVAWSVRRSLGLPRVISM